MKNIDNLDCRTVKELIIDKKISIDLLNEHELEKLINFETENIINSKTEPDMSFLNACYEAIGKYKDYKNIISEEAVSEIAENTYQEYLSAQVSNVKPKKHNRVFLKVAVSFASVCLILLSSFSVMALAMGGYSQAWSYISTHVHEILNMDGNKTEIDGIEIIKSDYTKKYDTIEELLSTENLDILYPSALPEGVKIEKIVIESNSNFKKISYVFSSDDINLNIKNTFDIDLSKLDNLKIFTVNNADFHIIELQDSTFQDVAHINEFEYTMNCIKYDDLIYILSNMKGLE